MHFLDRRVVRRKDPKLAGLHEIFIQAYDDEYDAIALAGQIGILRADIARYPKLRLTWWSILEESAREGQLRRLVDTALRDPTIIAWHTKIREIVEVPAGPLVTDEKPLEPAEPKGPDAGKTPEVGASADLWDVGSTLSIRFLDGSARLHARVEAAAIQWVEYANIKLSFDNAADAPIRISFKQAGSWSYQARNALKAPKDTPTTNFGWLREDTQADELERVVLHEFGHVLGFQHEHSNPASTLKWDKKKVYASFGGLPNLWSREQVDRAIFAIWPPGYYSLHKIFDRESIMMYPMPGEYFTDGEAIGWNRKLSVVDKQFAAAIYPLRVRAR